MALFLSSFFFPLPLLLSSLPDPRRDPRWLIHHPPAARRETVLFVLPIMRHLRRNVMP